MRNVMITIALVLGLMACTSEPPQQPNQKKAEMLEVYNRGLVAAKRFVATAKELNVARTGTISLSKCPLDRPELRAMNLGTSTDLPTTTTSRNLMDGTLSDLYEKYTPCVPFSSGIFRAVAQIESRQNTSAVNPNNDKFIGLFQTSPRVCEDAMRKYWPGESCQGLIADSQLQVAAQAALTRQIAKLIHSAMTQTGNVGEDNNLYYSLFYLGHYLGTGTLTKILRDGYPKDHVTMCRRAVQSLAALKKYEGVELSDTD